MKVIMCGNWHIKTYRGSLCVRTESRPLHGFYPLPVQDPMSSGTIFPTLPSAKVEKNWEATWKLLTFFLKKVSKDKVIMIVSFGVYQERVVGKESSGLLEKEEPAGEIAKLSCQEACRTPGLLLQREASRIAAPPKGCPGLGRSSWKQNIWVNRFSGLEILSVAFIVYAAAAENF